MSDADLIESSLVDVGAFAAIFDRHFRAIFRFLRGRVGEHLAEDLASETFVVAFKCRQSYDLSRQDARPWLFGIAVNLLREHRRQRNLTRNLGDEFEPALSPDGRRIVFVSGRSGHEELYVMNVDGSGQRRL